MASGQGTARCLHRTLAHPVSAVIDQREWLLGELHVQLPATVTCKALIATLAGNNDNDRDSIGSGRASNNDHGGTGHGWLIAAQSYQADLLYGHGGTNPCKFSACFFFGTGIDDKI